MEDRRLIVFALASVESNGFAMTPPLLTSTEVTHLIALIEAESTQDPNRGGVRDIMTRIPALTAVANHPNVRSIVEQLLGPEAFIVRSTLFDKTDAANWKVPWHQDVTIAVRERRDTEGFGPWSVKQGITHVQPTTEILANMLTIRVHLDDCPTTNGALRVMPGTHKLGRIDQNDASQFVDERRAITCEARVGEALVMRPLLLHASSVSQLPQHRRVLHFDFSATELPNGLTWQLR